MMAKLVSCVLALMLIVTYRIASRVCKIPHATSRNSLAIQFVNSNDYVEIRSAAVLYQHARLISQRMSAATLTSASTQRPQHALRQGFRLYVTSLQYQNLGEFQQPSEESDENSDASIEATQSIQFQLDIFKSRLVFQYISATNNINNPLRLGSNVGTYIFLSLYWLGYPC